MTGYFRSMKYILMTAILQISISQASAAFSIMSGPSASNITTNSALITWTLSTYGTGQVEYGLTTSYGSTSRFEPTFKFITHKQSLSGLESGRTYHYRVVSTSKSGVRVVSADKTFTTVNVPPSIISGPSTSNITASSALISWATSEVTQGVVEYGLTSAYGSSSRFEPSFKFSSHSQPIAGLQENTVYHYRAKSIDQSGAVVVSGDKTFTTLNAPPVLISGPSASSITSTSATISWATNEVTQGVVEYGLTSAYGSTSRFEPSFKFSSHTQILSGLTAGKVYHYRIKSIDQNGAQIVSADKTFSTLASATTTTLAPVTTTTLAPVTTTTTLAPTTTSLPPTSGTAPIELIVVPSYVTAGIIAKLPSGSASNVSGKIYYKRTEDAGYEEGFPFTRYDMNNMATSLFYLTPNTSYDFRIDYNNGSGYITSKSGSFRTKVDAGVGYPAAANTVNVSTLSQLQSAINNAQPGHHIILAAGTYLGTVSINNKVGTAANPIVIRGANYFDPMNPGTSSRAVLNGNMSGKTLSIVGSAYIVIDNIEVKNGGTEMTYADYGIEINSSSNITVQRSYIHDNGHYNIRITRSDLASSIGGPLKVGYHLIQNNFITDTSDRTACEANTTPYNGCSGITYEGISMDKISGGVTVIRNNRITNHIDNMTAPGNYAEARNLSESTAHVLKITNSTGIYLAHNIDIYNNEIYNGFDDDIESDGIGVNIRIFDNLLGSSAKPAHHALTASPLMPGPIFMIRNVIKNYLKSALKMNTGGEPSVPTRNIYMFHNTIVKLDSTRAMLNLWYGGSGYQGVKNMHFKNNIFTSPNGGRCTSINSTNYGGSPGTILNHNLWYSPTSSSSLFQWYNGSTIQNASSLSGFRSISGQEANGIFAVPALNSNYSLQSSSPAIDKGVRIPGINNRFKGAAPDMGAWEY